MASRDGQERTLTTRFGLRADYDDPDTVSDSDTSSSADRRRAEGSRSTLERTSEDHTRTSGVNTGQLRPARWAAAAPSLSPQPSTSNLQRTDTLPLHTNSAPPVTAVVLTRALGRLPLLPLLAAAPAPLLPDTTTSVVPPVPAPLRAAWTSTPETVATTETVVPLLPLALTTRRLRR